MFTWSLGCAPSPARLAITSLAFMFDEVPEPVWKTSIGNCVVVLAGGDLVGGGGDRLRELRVEQAEVAVDARGGALDAAEPVDRPRRARARRRSGSCRRPWRSRRRRGALGHVRDSWRVRDGGPANAYASTRRTRRSRARRRPGRRRPSGTRCAAATRSCASGSRSSASSAAASGWRGSSSAHSSSTGTSMPRVGVEQLAARARRPAPRELRPRAREVRVAADVGERVAHDVGRRRVAARAERARRAPGAARARAVHQQRGRGPASRRRRAARAPARASPVVARPGGAAGWASAQRATGRSRPSSTARSTSSAPRPWPPTSGRGPATSHAERGDAPRPASRRVYGWRGRSSESPCSGRSGSTTR